jgi:metacaspase-1
MDRGRPSSGADRVSAAERIACGVGTAPPLSRRNRTKGVSRVNIKARMICAALAALALGNATPAGAASRALLIGVGKYALPNNDLPGIDLDIENMKHVAKIMGFAPGEIKVLFDDSATYTGVKSALSTWVRDGVGANDRVLVYFSGHGTRVSDPRPAKAGELDDALVLRDVKVVKVNGHNSLANVLFGYEFGDALAAIPSRHILVLVDACHSGTATRTLSLGNRRLGEGSGAVKSFNWPGAPVGQTRGLKATTGGENYAAISAARDDEFAIATEHGGLFTLGVLDAIDAASRDARRPSVADLRTATAAYIEKHTDEQQRHHPVADGNKQLIEGQLNLIPLRNGNGPTWAALDALAKQGEAMTVKAGASELKLGDEIVLSTDVPRAGYLNVVAIDSQDRATVLYPNQFSPSNSVPAGPFQFPTASMNFALRATEPAGPTLVVAFLSDKQVNLLDLGVEGRDAAGKMQSAFTEVTARATRALSVEARHQGFAAGAVTINVKP